MQGMAEPLLGLRLRRSPTSRARRFLAWGLPLRLQPTLHESQGPGLPWLQDPRPEPAGSLVSQGVAAALPLPRGQAEQQMAACLATLSSGAGSQTPVPSSWVHWTVPEPWQPISTISRLWGSQGKARPPDPGGGSPVLAASAWLTGSGGPVLAPSSGGGEPGVLASGQSSEPGGSESEVEVQKAVARGQGEL